MCNSLYFVYAEKKTFRGEKKTPNPQVSFYSLKRFLPIYS